MHKLIEAAQRLRLKRSKASGNNVAQWHIGSLRRDVRKATQLSWAVERTRHLNGDVVECGVGSGWSLSLLAQMLENEPRRLHAVDTFAGFPSPSEHDSKKFSPKGQWKIYSEFDVQFVQQNLHRAGVSAKNLDKIIFHAGDVGEILGRRASPISLLHLDLDLYRSYRDALTHGWQLIQESGLILVDEYDTQSDLDKWPGAKAAIDEFAAANSLSVSRHWSGFCYFEKHSRFHNSEA